MDKFVAFLLFVGVLIASFNNIDAVRVSKKAFRAEAPRNCGPENFKNLHRCCNLPELMEYAVYNKCMNALETTAKYQMEKTASIKKSASLSDFLNSIFRVEAKKGQKSENLIALPPGSTCVMDCVYKNYNFVDDNGKLIHSAIKERFVKEADSVWAPIIREAYDKCTNLTSNASPKPPIKTGDQTCLQEPAGMTSCVQRYLVKDCPAEKKSESMKSDEQCKEQIEKLNKCDPLQRKSSNAG